MEIETFVKEQLKKLPYGRGYIFENEEIEFDEKRLVQILGQVKVYKLTQEEIDEAIENYPDYYEELKAGDIVYDDGEVPFKIDALDIWLSEIKSNWKKGVHSVNDIQDYLTYLYAGVLSDSLA